MSPTDTQTLIAIDGTIYEALHVFGPDAAGIEWVIIRYVGLLVFAYRLPGEQAWRLEDAHSPPTSPEQDAVMDDMVRADGLDTTTVKVESPGGD